jgi:hypothetical protein
MLLLGATALLTACSTSGPGKASRFHEEANADVIVRYFSDQTSYVLKPAKLEGEFQSMFSRDEVLNLIQGQAGRDLAVVVLGRYGVKSMQTKVLGDWDHALADMGFRRRVFLQGGNSSKVAGLPVLEDVGTANLVTVASHPGF